MHLARTRVNAMEHPSYNNWTLRERLSLPLVRIAVWKFAASLALVSTAALFYAMFSLLLITSAPIFYAHLDDVQEERWRNKAAFYGRACGNETARFVVIDCNQTHTAYHRDGFMETITRTLSDLSQHDQVVTGSSVLDLFGCRDSNGWCMSVIYLALDVVINYRMLMLTIWWLSTTAMLCVAGLQRGPLQYWKRLQLQLVAASPDTVRYNAMTASMREEWMTAQAEQAMSPPKKPFIEYVPWTPPAFKTHVAGLNQPSIPEEPMRGRGEEEEEEEEAKAEGIQVTDNSNTNFDDEGGASNSRFSTPGRPRLRRGPH